MNNAPKTATKVENVDSLLIQNLKLRQQLLDTERNQLVNYLIAKYCPGQTSITVLDDGTIQIPNPINESVSETIKEIKTKKNKI